MICLPCLVVFLGISSYFYVHIDLLIYWYFVVFLGISWYLLLVFFVWQYFSFSQFALGLNELHAKTCNNLPPTDGRLRPDLRLFEQGDLGTVRLL